MSILTGLAVVVVVVVVAAFLFVLASALCAVRETDRRIAADVARLAAGRPPGLM